MDITFTCDKCGQSLTIDEAGAGQLVDCPGCGTQLEVPHKSKFLDGAARANLRPAATGPLSPSLPTSDTKKCPFCAEAIKVEAIVCRYCGRALQTSGQVSPKEPTNVVAARSGVWDGFRIGLGFVLALVVIGILFFVLRGMYLNLPDPGALQKAKLKAAQDEIHNISAALDLYELDNGILPSTEQGLQALIAPPTSAPVPGNWRGPYLMSPVSLKDPWNHAFVYRQPGYHLTTSYDIFSHGPDGIAGNEDDIGNWQ